LLSLAGLRQRRRAAANCLNDCDIVGVNWTSRGLLDRPTQVARAIDDYRLAHEALESLGVVRSQRTVADYGEWLAAEILSLPICTSRTQKDWDLELTGRRVQVKTHAKASTNRARRTPISKTPLAYDELAIVVLTPTLRLREFYLLPRVAVEQLAKPMGDKRTLHWSVLAEFALREVPARLAPLLSADTHLDSGAA
jgi:hypothetical protein